MPSPVRARPPPRLPSRDALQRIERFLQRVAAGDVDREEARRLLDELRSLPAAPAGSDREG